MEQFLQSRQIGSTLLVTITTEDIPHSVLRLLRNEYSRVLPGENLLFVIGTKHTFHDEELLGIFVAAYRRITALGGKFGIVPNQDVARWIESLGFTRMPGFATYSDVNQALEVMNG